MTLNRCFCPPFYPNDFISREIKILMDKKYFAPNIETIEIDTLSIMDTGSITSVGGTAGLDLGDDNNVPTEAGSRNSSVWEEEEEYKY